jgi:Bacterial pre-peptidase C-terminal domain
MKTKLTFIIMLTLLLLAPNFFGAGGGLPAAAQEQPVATATPGPSNNSMQPSSERGVKSGVSVQRQKQATIPRAATAQIVPASMRQDFEGAWPSTGWALFDNSDADGGEYMWGKRTCFSHSGMFGGLAIGGGARGQHLGCFAGYPTFVNTWVTYGPFDLSGTNSAALIFYMRGSLEYEQNCGYDYFFVGSSRDDSDYYGTFYCGDWTQGATGNGFYQGVLDLSDQRGNSQVWVGFQFWSDYSGSDLGVTIDDVLLSTDGAPVPSPQKSAGVYLPLLNTQLPTTPCNDVEDNDYAIHAWQFTTIGGACVGSLEDDPKGNDDYYYVDLIAGQTIRVDLTHIPDGADYDMVLYDKQILSTGNAPELRKTKQPNNSDERMTYLVPASGRYYIRIYLSTKSANAPNSYVLQAIVS